MHKTSFWYKVVFVAIYSFLLLVLVSGGVFVAGVIQFNPAVYIAPVVATATLVVTWGFWFLTSMFQSDLAVRAQAEKRFCLTVLALYTVIMVSLLSVRYF
ncbi:hypothetical protein KBC79_04445 [Candidatus Woesebacteria bacterium]|nr:hypothetical protein [Candidatus Woesebacteria bacterium]